MNIANLMDAITTRAKADTGSGGLFASGTPLVTNIYAYFGSKTLAYPYIVVNVTAEASDTFTTDGLRCEVEFHIYADAANGLITPGKIIDRIRGNGVSQTNRVPTYGFHRWPLTVDQESPMFWVGGMMRYLRSNTAHDKETYHFIETYEVYQQSPLEIT